jgi:hypothetical protein
LKTESKQFPESVGKRLAAHKRPAPEADQRQRLLQNLPAFAAIKRHNATSGWLRGADGAGPLKAFASDDVPDRLCSQRLDEPPDEEYGTIRKSSLTRKTGGCATTATAT